VENTHNACIILVIVPIIHPLPCSDLRTKSDLNVDVPDVVENIIGCVVLVVLEDGQHIGHLQVSFLFCSCEECCTTGSACAYVTHPLDEEGSSVVHTLQPVDGLEVCVELIGIPPNHGLVVMLKVEAIGDGVSRGRPLHCLVASPQTMKVFEQSLRSLDHLDGDEGDDLLKRTVPNATCIHPPHRLHGAALWESGSEGEWKWKGRECKCG
jgi:hypothetical protein